MQLNREKVNEILRTCKPGTVYTEAFLCAMQDISLQTYGLRCKECRWKVEQLKGLAYELGEMRGSKVQWEELKS